MKKADVLTFIVEKISIKEKTLRTKKSELVELLRDSVSRDIGEVRLPSKIADVAQQMQNMKSEHVPVYNSYVDKPISEAFRAIEFRDAVIDHIMTDVVGKYLVYGTNSTLEIIANKYPTTRVLLDEVYKEYNDILNKLDHLTILSRELKAVVKASSSAKIALERLNELGMDTSDIKVKGELPAVIKLSVDLNILN